ncbi:MULTISPECIES: Stk1 family PASTA domain-containing Ser/Thr kinase [Lacticaseibacillus]|uniref:non-specific serine/threonine protein kinase n=2 Tax=Lacticaseibacillus TaxID=2759736 RepID=A0AAN1C8C3_LACCA|nr:MULTISPECIES: Stk1 family PASTA domain-containing Ser/Thr kinase [Lacticaseibacillus]ARY91669.1 protein kinase [Lacticaseibacillus casei]KAB1968823.1 Stk1 family PASTA domain-containing Ser/Thr kinase [Lacticaseibacillus casei]WLV79568.1 Stk1 family PASTA domain-containing Ser/Thr kinase [Lacticaseibacillus sp. NCIMB 15473]WNX23528.1 Stk1 family PASTA domain-containing Ser/Thr kinase [Lacticaseibacillus casei]WNX26303.1 Stk1 family PASTA domain-containing Ser/Thr kinase [Lacticaseibacillus 
MIEPGTILNERYKLIKTLGEGGMANVYLAHDLILDRDVAVKVLRLDLQNDPDTVRRFQREAMATSELVHPNIVSIYDVGESHGQQFLVMEYVKGSDLKHYIVEHFPIPYQRVVDMMEEILSAVQTAHDHNIIHRDLKPQNILIDANGHAKITDFGIAVALSENSMTMTNSLLGSVHYLSPEQARGSMPTRQSDIYALGIILFEMLTGSVPFEGDSAVSIALKHFQEEVPSVRAFDPHIPQALENVVFKATAKNPANRYTSAEAMASDLNTALSPARAHEAKYVVPKDDLDETRVVPIVPNGPTPPHNSDGGADQPANQSAPENRPKKKRRRWLIVAISAVVVLLLLIGIGVVTANQKADVTVPDLRGMTTAQAKTALKSARLKVGKYRYAYSTKVDKDLVIDSDPKRQVSVKESSSVNLILSRGQPRITLDNYVGQDYSDAKSDLQKRGVTVKEKLIKTNEAAAGKILSQSIKAGTKVIASKTTITFGVAEPIKVKKDNTTFALRDLTGYTEKSLRDYANEVGLKIVISQSYSDTVDTGMVISQNPAAGTQVQSGDTVNVTISQGADPDKVKTVSKTISIPYQAPSAASGSASASASASSSGVTPNGIQVFIGDKTHNISDINKTFNITADDQVTITLQVSKKYPGSYRVVRDGTVIAQEANITQ